VQGRFLETEGEALRSENSSVSSEVGRMIEVIYLC
jgi:hypothetical protein